MDLKTSTTWLLGAVRHVRLGDRELLTVLGVPVYRRVGMHRRYL